MPVDLGGALAGWVVSLAGESAIRLVRGSQDERDLVKAMELAIDNVVEQADSSSRDALRLGLRQCFEAPLQLQLDASTSVSDGFRAAISAQVAQLDQMAHGDSGQRFYEIVQVDRVWLVERVTTAIVTALRQVTAKSKLPGLVHGIDTADILEELRLYRTGKEHSEKAFVRRRREGLLEQASASRGRLIARWVSVGISTSLAQELADDLSLGSPVSVCSKLVESGLAVLEGDFGSGKSVVAERWYGEALANALENDHAAVPIYLEAQSVKDSLIAAVREETKNLGDPRLTGIRLVLDGLDESGSARAERLLNEARALRYTWPQCQILATARTGLTLEDDERITQPSMGEDQTVALIERVGGHRSILQDESAGVRDTLHLPLFALIAAIHWKTPAGVPRSRGVFIETLVNSALNRMRRPAGEARRGLMRLASLATNSKNAVLAAELGDEDTINMIMETRLVIRKGRALAFSLPVIEQYFAGQAVLDAGLDLVELDDLNALDRWRYPLVLAITAGSWEKTNALLHKLASANPGLAAWVTSAAVPDSGDTPATEPPKDLECARRLHQTLGSWIGALGALGPKLSLTNKNGNARTVAASVHNKQVATALGSRDGTGPGAIQLPLGFNIFTGQAADGSQWGPSRVGCPPADFAAWPWHWSLDWASSRIESLLTSMALPLPEQSPMYAERRWTLANALSSQSNGLHRPINADKISESAERLLSNRHASLFHFRGGLSFTRDELNAFSDWISSDHLIRQDRLLRRPYPIPDVDARDFGHIAGLYTNETLRDLVEQVYTNALLIYGQLVDTWFPKLRGILELGCLLPVVVKGTLIPGQGAGWDAEPDFVFHMAPLPPGETSKAEVQLMGHRKDINVDQESLESQRREIWRLINIYRPGAEGWTHLYEWTTALWVFKNMPATAQAHRWLWADLHKLRLINKMCPIFDY